MIQRLILTLTLSVLVSACGGGGGGGSGDEAGVTNPTTPGNTTTVLEGTWIKPCGLGVGEDANNATTVYDVVALTFTNNMFDTSIENFTDPSCTTPTPLSPMVTASATFIIGNSISTTGSLQATEINTTTTSSNGAPVSGVSFDIFYIVPNSSPTIFYLGDTLNSGNGSTAQLRPNTLDMSRAFALQ